MTYELPRQRLCTESASQQPQAWWPGNSAPLEMHPIWTRVDHMLTLLILLAFQMEHPLTCTGVMVPSWCHYMPSYHSPRPFTHTWSLEQWKFLRPHHHQGQLLHLCRVEALVLDGKGLRWLKHAEARQRTTVLDHICVQNSIYIYNYIIYIYIICINLSACHCAPFHSQGPQLRMLRPHPPNAFWTFVVPAPLHLPCRHWSLTIKISIQNRPNAITPSSWLAERCCGIRVQMAQTKLNISLMLCASHMFFCVCVCVPLSLSISVSLSLSLYLPPSLSISLPLFSLPLFVCMRGEFRRLAK